MSRHYLRVPLTIDGRPWDAETADALAAVSALLPDRRRRMTRPYVPIRLWPISFQAARRFVSEYHRHSDPPIAVRVSVGIVDADQKLRGVGMLGIPKARMSMDGVTAEIVRVATDGVPNGCSMLYGALVRAAWALGYDRVLTYTLPEESGSSLLGAGWTREGEVTASKGRDWSAHTNGVQAQQKPTLFYEAKVPVGPKVKWSILRHGTRAK